MTMEKKDKELILKDLCARLLYGVIVKYMSRESEGDVKLGCGNIGYVLQLGNGWWKECKPYLRPMSSMTEEEELVFSSKCELTTDVNGEKVWSVKVVGYDWLNKHHFDYRGLIELGLAIEAPEGMYI
jgi:hypothetical protein